MKTQTTAQPETIFDRELRPLVQREVMSNPAPAIPSVRDELKAAAQRALEAMGNVAGKISAIEHGYFYDATANLRAAIADAEPMSRASGDVLAERRRQIDVEGWTPEHDAAHGAGELASAGMGYAQSAACQLSHGGEPLEGLPLFWPWAAEWWKPKNSRRDLVRAAALIIAEIERMDRAKS